MIAWRCCRTTRKRLDGVHGAGLLSLTCMAKSCSTPSILHHNFNPNQASPFRCPSQVPRSITLKSSHLFLEKPLLIQHLSLPITSSDGFGFSSLNFAATQFHYFKHLCLFHREVFSAHVKDCDSLATRFAMFMIVMVLARGGLS